MTAASTLADGPASGGVPAENPLLRIHDLTMRFGGVLALDALSLEVSEGQTCGIIGPNGAGKTTLLNVVSGFYAPASGTVEFRGSDLRKRPRRSLASMGVTRTFQNLGLFAGLTALENVMVGAHSASRGGFAGCVLRLPKTRASERATRRRCLEMMHRLELERFADSPVQGLSYGTLKRIELARALAASPRLLLLDEPAAGLTHPEVDELVELLRELKRASDLTIVVVEHHMRLVMALSDRIAALNFGRLLAYGKPADVATNPGVVEAYLGGSE